ncbi:MAG: cation:dicarboxylase symporter family transporter [Candidatus Korobacteraceae bacterium]|jgi:aerobic C4-dicarboxylate transport protein
MKLLKQLYIQVLIGLAAAVVLGFVAPATAVKMKPLGDGFIGLLRMLLGPIIFVTVVHGMANVRDMRKLGRLGTKALIYFESVSTLGIIVGGIAVNVFRPGVGLHAKLDNALPASIAAVSAAATKLTVVNFLLSIIPLTMVDAFAKGEILQVLFISLLVGIALSMTVKRDSVILAAIAEFQTILFKILSFIMRLAPLGAFGAMAAAIGGFGATTLLFLGRLIIVYYASCLFFIFVVFGIITKLTGITIFQVLRLIKEEILLVFGTASGEVAFPRLIEKLEKAGCDEAVVGFVLPGGYSFNLDGTGIQMTLSAVFIAQVSDTPFSWSQQLALFAVMLFTSKGGTTVAGGAFIKLAATLQSVRVLPLGGLGLLLGIDRFMATGSAVTNMIGNTVAVLAIAKWDKAFDREKFYRYLASKDAEPSVPGKAGDGHEAAGAAARK